MEKFQNFLNGLWKNSTGFIELHLVKLSSTKNCNCDVKGLNEIDPFKDTKSQVSPIKKKELCGYASEPQSCKVTYWRNISFDRGNEYKIVI